MTVQGEMLIGQTTRSGNAASFRGFDPAKREQLEPVFGGGTGDDVDQACALAAAAFDSLRAASPQARAVFLEAIAENLEAAAETIVPRAIAETGLPEARIRGELGRTTGQLRLFARTARDAGYLDARIDHALPNRVPPRPDIRMVHQPLGPVAVFGASNFPLAFSVAGGDTASAFAAGCPVIVKAHNAHPGTSELAGRAIQQAVKKCGLPEGTFSLLFGSGQEIGVALVADPRIQAVGFTGSYAGGTALMKVARDRVQPIPVYAEMSSINPVVLLPGALAERGEAIGAAFAGALTLGAGQFCTNPGLVLALEASDTDAFVKGAKDAIAAIKPATMLTPAIHNAYRSGIDALASNTHATRVIEGDLGEGLVSQPNLFEVTAADLMSDQSLTAEVFGASSVLVRCEDAGELVRVIDRLGGQLTASVHVAQSDFQLAHDLLPSLERRAGRVLFNGFGTGVEVCDAMVHGGPYPSTSDGRSTSVGSLAIMRFLRPVCYQDVPDVLLPAVLQEANPLSVPRRVNGVLS